jgi:PAS domain S-box-containing protein
MDKLQQKISELEKENERLKSLLTISSNGDNKNRNNFEGFFNLAIDLLCIADIHGNFIKVNKSWENVLGYSLEYLESHKFFDFVHPDDLPSTLLQLENLAKQEQVVNFVNRYRCKNGTWRYIEWRSLPLGDLIYAAARDITKRINDEIRLKQQNDDYLELTEKLSETNTELGFAKLLAEERERNYKEIFNSTSDAIFVHNAKTGNIIDVSTTMLKMYGFSEKSQIIGGNISQISAVKQGYTLSKANELIRKAISDENNTFEWLAKKSNGECFWVEVSLRSTQINNQSIVLASVRDISKRKEAEENFRLSHETYKGILDSLNEAVYILDNQDCFVEVNKTAEGFYGYPRDYFIGKTPEFLSAPNRNNFDEVVKTLKEAFNGNPGIFEFWGIKKNGDVFPKEVSVSPGVFFGKKSVIAVARDISERKESEFDLKRKNEQIETQNIDYKKLTEELLVAKERAEQSETKFRNLVESAFDGIYLIEGRGFNYVNPRFTEITGYTFEELTSEKFDFTDLLSTKTKKIIDNRYHARISGETIPARYEFQIITKGNELKDVEVSTVPLRANGDPLVMGIMKDITPRRKLEREISYRSKLQTLLINLGAKFINIPHHIIEREINSALAEMGNFSEVDRVYIFTYDFVNDTMTNTHEWCSEGTLSQIKNLQNLPNSLVPEWVNAHKEGNIVYIPNILDFNESDNIRKILEPQGVKSLIAIPMIYSETCFGFVGFDAVKNYKQWSDSQISLLKLFAELLVNVQVKTRYEKRLKEAKVVAEVKQMEVRNIIDYSPVGIVLINPNGNVIDVNNAAVKMLGSPSVEATKKLNLFETKPLIAIGFTNDLQHCLTTKEMVYNEKKYTSVWGKEIFVKYYLVPIVIEGEVESVLANIEDITHVKETEQKLISLKDKAEESDRLKTAFLSNMSHEIRTPMNAICGFSNLLINNSFNDEQRNNFVEIININSQQLLSIINDIIDVSKIEAGQVSISYSNISVNDIIDEMQTIFSPTVKMKGVELIVSKGLSGNDSKIVSDELKIKQILSNLIYNAIKFTERGRIEVGYRLANSYLEFYVNDTGIGINPENFELIFERFQQVEGTTNESRKGTGLGLPISKAFVELLGGQIGLTSTVGVGTNFFFSIPYIHDEIQQGKPDSNVNLQNIKWGTKTILIAEDDHPNFMYIRELLRVTHANVLRAKNGQEAIEMCNANTIDLVLMDIKMPILNGLEAATRLREQGFTTPIIAQTAYAFSDDKQRAIESGCNDYISKPIRQEDLLKLIGKWLDSSN